MARQRAPMSAVDRSWLRMETATNPMMIGVVLVFEKPIPIGTFRRILEERFLRFRRFRQRVVTRGGKTWWEDDPNFDLDHHLHLVSLPGKGDKQALQQLASDLNSTPLDFRRPLWQIHYVDHYKEGCALMVRIHHCIADGISLVRVLLSLTDNSPQSKVTPMRPVADETPVPQGWLSHTLNRTREQWEQTSTSLNKTWERIRTEPRYLRKLGRDGLDAGREMVRLGLAPPAPETPLKGELCGRKKVAWAEPLDLKQVKAMAKALGGTVNDVLMSVATAALHSYLRQAGELLPTRDIRIAVPFNLRPLNQPIETLGNQFGLVLVPLPVSTTCPMRRFQQVQKEMNRLKRSKQAVVTYSLLNLFGRGPDKLERFALDFLSGKASAVMTNVPGPRSAIYLGGSRLLEPMFWVPQTGGVGLGLSIFTYDGKVQFGLIADKRLIDCPDDVVARFVEGFHELSNHLRGDGEKQSETLAPLNIA